MTIHFADGEPYWTMLATPDFDSTPDFYAELFGWQVDVLGPETGPTALLSYEGSEVGGMGPTEPGGQSWWTPYFKVADAHAAARRVTAAGGTVLSGPMDAFDQLTMVVFAAPDGAIAVIGQPRAHIGARRWGEVGSVSEVTLLAFDAGAADFYREVFGWHTADNTVGKSLMAAGQTRPFGNMHIVDPDDSPPGVRPSWLVAFRVGDVDAFAARAQRMGATVPVGPMDVPEVGRNAFILDPNSAGFTIVRRDVTGP